MSKTITALCDKIIELDDSRDFKFIATILKEGNQNVRILGVDWGYNRIPFGTPTDFVDKESYNDLCFTASKLARALKEAITNLEKMTDIRLPGETLEEIEEIFK